MLTPTDLLPRVHDMVVRKYPTLHETLLELVTREDLGNFLSGGIFEDTKTRYKFMCGILGEESIVSVSLGLLDLLHVTDEDQLAYREQRLAGILVTTATMYIAEHMVPLPELEALYRESDYTEDPYGINVLLPYLITIIDRDAVRKEDSISSALMSGAL